MSEPRIEHAINETLIGDTQRNALAFVAYLSTNEILSVRLATGYWEDKLYFVCSYRGKSVCYILINGYEEGSWVIWSDDSGSNWFEEFPLDEHTKEIAWRNVDVCTGGNCAGCSNPGRGTRKTIFGKEINHVCGTAMKFINPDAETVECMKRIFEMRKNDILETM